MNLSRRQALAAFGALSAAAVLPGCSGFTRDTAGDAAAQDTDTLTFTTWGSDPELQGFRDAIAAFEQANGGVTVQLNAVPYEQFFPNIDAQLQSDTAPDVFRVDYDNLGTYAGRGQLLDLSSLLDAEVGGSFTEQMWEAVQFDDTPFGVPHHTDTSALLLNVAALEAAGVTDVPTSPEEAWSWERFAEVAQALKATAPQGRSAFAVNWQGQGITRWLSWLFQADGRFLSDDLSAPAIDSDAGRRAIDFTSSFFTDGLVPANSSVKSSTYASDLFFAETVAMVFGGAFLLPQAQELAPFEWTATYSPRDARGGSDLGGNALVATAGTQKGELAAAFLAFMTEREQMDSFCATASLLPTRTDLVDQGVEFAVRPELSTVFLGQAATVQPGDAEQVASPSMAAINTVLSDAMEGAFVSGRTTDQTVEEITAGIEQALQG
jgi:multiple sugar transport system substrate-binding protein